LNNKKKEVKKYNNNPANMRQPPASTNTINSDLHKLGLTGSPARGTSREHFSQTQ
jgi:hypothetical protein